MKAFDKDLARKLGSYSLAAGAAAGTAAVAEAAPIVFDTEASPIVAKGDFFASPYNFAVIDPTVGSIGGLIGLVSDTVTGNGANVSSPSDGLITSSRVYLRYNLFPDAGAGAKDGSQFGILAGGGNGLYALPDGASTVPEDADGSSYGFEDGDVIGDGPEALLTTSNTGESTQYVAGGIQANIKGFGAGGSFGGYAAVTGDKYLGFSLGGLNGFVKTRSAGARNEIHILGWGIETSGGPINASLTSPTAAPPIPEPSTATLALLGLGAVGVLGYRSMRRR